ncbi:hypothetical protein EIP91_006141 [Steccherinum ochraceum]|uniref:Uncharacterized protein n=1 Tax=Steccherinum ochraceum TaxID=92696 RepID=A0A4R0RZA9_9APHY|nr:hypothetical protein EIP91_006141 [Steccherinum ochraceum]
MSQASYKLEAPRPRPPPLPLRTQNLHNLPKRTPSPGLARKRDSSQTLLYDLPQAAVSPSPTRAFSGMTSPTSPNSRRASRGMRMTPPPGGSARAPTSSRPARNDLEEFAQHCRAWYYDQDDNAGRLMTQTLATLPPSQRAPFARMQGSIRSAYHASVNARRNAEFQAHITATHPGGSLMPHSRADPRGPLARKERYDRLERFVRTWCTVGMPGTKPFFEGFWAVMRLQVIPQDLGGAGGHRIEWEIDDAVFKEAAGKDFMLEAIDVLKGVLGFEEFPSPRRSPSIGGSSPRAHSTFFDPPPFEHSRSQSQPLATHLSVPVRPSKSPPITTTTHTKRARAPSDPFLDTPAVSASYSSNASAQLSTSVSSTIDDPPTPITPPNEVQDLFAAPVQTGHELPDAGDYLRTWVSPDLSDPEFLSLLNVFPAFVVRHPLPRLPVSSSSRRPADVEEAPEESFESKHIRVGTGTMWLGYKLRTPGYEGSWWTRFKLWWKRLFC